MKTYEFGNPDAKFVLIQPVDDHDLIGLANEAAYIERNSSADFQLIAVKIDDWNHDLSPWNAPAVFGNEDFGSGAKDTLDRIIDLCADPQRTYYIGGYSLAGLFSLWAVFETDRFSGAAAASPSMWFPEFIDFMKSHELRTNSVYLSLGNRENRTRNPIMATVGDRIREAYDLLNVNGTNCTLEWNEGNHFKDPDVRSAKAFSWLLNHPM
ncbi:MAG: esterase [Clostridia bacterium]|nr:esterase [Clostridia bacterium]